MLLKTKILLVAIGSVFVTAGAGLLIQRSVIRQQGINLTRDTMRATVLSAENTRRSVSAMRNAHMFDDAGLKADLAGASDFRLSNIYKTVPVVAAWNSITDVAAKEGYEFRVPARNARNAKNNPRPDEENILARMDSERLPEYFEVNEKANEVLYARPIELSQDCLLCHGDPSNSATKDGKDLLGYRMENWHTGDRHGMFLLRSKLDTVDAVVAAGMGQTAMWLLPLSVLVGFGVHFFISRISSSLASMIENIAEASSHVASASAEISSASQTLAQGASEQAASLEETSAASEELTASTRRNAENSKTAAAEVDKVDRRIREGNSALEEMLVSMVEIRDSSHKIAKIIRVIDEIAFQTNILALNAAVEAARAGAAGAGFAVVADEVRNLAQRSSEAAKDSAPLIEESIARADAGGVKLEELAQVIRDITSSTVRVKTLVDQVSAGSRDQAREIEDVARAFQQIDKVTQSSAASSEESAAAGQQLAVQADSMNRIARQLREVVAG